MRRRVDAAGEPGGDDKACFAKFARDPLGEFQSRARGVARADDCHIGSASARIWPRIVRSGGASSIICSRCG